MSPTAAAPRRGRRAGAAGRRLDQRRDALRALGTATGRDEHRVDDAAQACEVGSARDRLLRDQGMARRDRRRERERAGRERHDRGGGGARGRGIGRGCDLDDADDVDRARERHQPRQRRAGERRRNQHRIGTGEPRLVEPVLVGDAVVAQHRSRRCAHPLVAQEPIASAADLARLRGVVDAVLVATGGGAEGAQRIAALVEAATRGAGGRVDSTCRQSIRLV